MFDNNLMYSNVNGSYNILQINDKGILSYSLHQKNVTNKRFLHPLCSIETLNNYLTDFMSNKINSNEIRKIIAKSYLGQYECKLLSSLLCKGNENFDINPYMIYAQYEKFNNKSTDYNFTCLEINYINNDIKVVRILAIISFQDKEHLC